MAVGAGSGRPPIVLVSLDTLRADRLGAYGDPRGLTPNLDRFAGDAVVFERAYSQANGTVQSHASLFTSRYPSELDRLSPAYHLPGGGSPTLARVLGAYGYQAWASVAGGHLDPAFGFSVGFDEYRASRSFGSLYHTVPVALDWVDGRDPDRPFFLFVHGYEAHARYLKPPPFGYSQADPAHAGLALEIARDPVGTPLVVDGLFHADAERLRRAQAEEPRPRSPEVRARVAREAARSTPPARSLGPGDVEHLRGVYDGAVTYVDAMFGAFVDRLRARGLLDAAWIVVLSDHGEQLGEDGVFAHFTDMGEAEMHVPLIVRPPGGVPGGRRVPDVVELVDVLPTLCEVAGAKLPSGVRGRSLLPAVRGTGGAGDGAAFGQSIFRQVFVRTAEARLTLSGMNADAPWLADVAAALPLASPAFSTDPGTPAADLARARDRLVGRLRRLVPPPSTRSPLALPGHLVRDLRDKGYWEAGP